MSRPPVPACALSDPGRRPGRRLAVIASLSLIVPALANTLFHVFTPLSRDSPAAQIAQARLHPHLAYLAVLQFLLPLLVVGVAVLAWRAAVGAPRLAVIGGGLLCCGYLLSGLDEVNDLLPAIVANHADTTTAIRVVTHSGSSDRLPALSWGWFTVVLTGCAVQLLRSSRLQVNDAGTPRSLDRPARYGNNGQTSARARRTLLISFTFLYGRRQTARDLPLAAQPVWLPPQAHSSSTFAIEPVQKAVTSATSSAGHSSDGRLRDPEMTAEQASLISAAVSAHSAGGRFC